MKWNTRSQSVSRPRHRGRVVTNVLWLPRYKISFLLRTRDTNNRAYEQIIMIQGRKRVGPIKSHGAMSRKMVVACDPDWKVATP